MGSSVAIGSIVVVVGVAVVVGASVTIGSDVVASSVVEMGGNGTALMRVLQYVVSGVAAAPVGAALTTFTARTPCSGK